MGGSNTSINNVGGDSLARGVIKDVHGAVALSAGETIESRRGVSLGNGVRDRNTSIGFNVGDLISAVHAHDHVIIGINSHGAPGVHLERVDFSGKQVASETALAKVALLDSGGEHSFLGVDGSIVEGVIVDDDVAIGDDILGSWVDDWKAHKGVGVSRSCNGGGRQGSSKRRSQQKQTSFEGGEDCHVEVLLICSV